LPYKDCLIAETKWLTDFEKIIEASGVQEVEEAKKVNRIKKKMELFTHLCFVLFISADI